MKNRNIIIIGLQPWYTDIGSNCKSLATEFAKENRVLYVNIPLNRNTLRNERLEPPVVRHLQIIRGNIPSIQEISPSFWQFYPGKVHESINWIPNTRLFSNFNYINNKRLAEDIGKAAKALHFDHYILFNDNDIFRGFWLKELLTPDLYIYYCRDFLTASGYFKRHGAYLEPLHIAKADLAVSNSIFLTQYLEKYNTNSHFVGQGCNLDLFDPSLNYNFPADIKKEKKPIIGYVGNLTARRLNIDIFVDIAQRRPDWHLLLVGPEDNEFLKSRLHQLSNVTFTGKKRPEELPAYVQTFDVCLNPQLVNELTIGNYPLKIDEYLAMGKPAVATRTHAMEMFRDYCYLAENSEDYINLINKALHEDHPTLQKKRMEFANQHSWANSAGTIAKHIENTLSKKEVSEILPASYPGLIPAP